MVNKTLKARLLVLEAAAGDGPMQVMQIDSVPDAQQLRDIADAERLGRKLVVFVRRGDTAWMPGCGEPAPWHSSKGKSHGE
jgi:hypothetical protein